MAQNIGLIRMILNQHLILLSFIFIVSSSSVHSQDDPTISNSTITSDSKISKANEYRASEALESIRDWASLFGRDIHYGTQEATCMRTIRDQFDPATSDTSRRGPYKSSIVSVDWTRLHSDIVKTISNAMGWHRTAVEAIAKASEQFASSHNFSTNLTFDYIDVHKLQNADDELDSTYLSGLDPVGLAGNANGLDDSTSAENGNDDSSVSSSTSSSLGNQELGQSDANVQSMATRVEDQPEQLPKPSELVLQQDSPVQASQANDSTFQGEWETSIRYIKLTRHRNFDVLVNTEESAVHVPVHLYPGDPPMMNGIAWSDQLTKVFRDNYIRNPKLTNQYFASQLGFMRLFPAQQWQIAKSDPDLYDSRMRPWYVAGASSRKDVVILVDGSGSMTGSRRDIAKGVVFEILDTLTDNDHFLILKFSDVIEQVGVPKCEKMQLERKMPNIPLKNTVFHPEIISEATIINGTDINSLYLLPATGTNVRHVKTNFTIATSGIANFSNALVTAFEVLRKYQDSEQHGSQCNQAIMLITDGSPSSFEDIFNRYNYPNAPVRVFTYLIGRESNDGSNSKMMACHNRGYYTHVINLAEVRETVQQYIPVMARPLVLNGTHPIIWTPAYGELTYQILTDWIWESKRRDKARAILASSGRGAASNAAQSNSGFVPDIKVTNDDGFSMDSNDDDGYETNLDKELDAIDLFGYNANIKCFWETRENDLLTTVIQPVYDRKNESTITEKFLVKNIWTIRETVMRTAQILGVAAADMKINDIIALAPSYKLGPNGYAVMLTNNGLVMHHPNLRSILEPFTNDPSERNMRILKPFFSSLDFTQVEHILNQDSDKDFVDLRKESVAGLTGWRELVTKRTLDCQKRVQSRRQKFYFKPIQQYPFSFMISIPESYGSHRIEAQVEIKSSSLPEKLTTYFTNSDYDIWTVHPKYQYCDGPSNITIATLLDMLQRIEARKLDDIQWKPAESNKPPLFLPGKIVCDKELVQSLVYDAVATFGFSETCSPPAPNSESSLLGMLGVRFSFVATRSGLTRVRHFNAEDMTIKKEALAFAKRHSRAIEENFYLRSVDYNMLINASATLIQVPYNTHQKIRDRLINHDNGQINNLDGPFADPSRGPDSDPEADASTRLSVKDMTLLEKLDILTNKSLHAIATQSIIVNEGAQRAVAGVAGVFYDYPTFVLRFFNLTNTRLQEGKPITKPAVCFTSNPPEEICDDSKALKCGHTNDTVDCLLVDNNGYIVVSEDLDFIGRHLRAYEPTILNKLVSAGVFHEINITDYQSVCMKQEEKQQVSGTQRPYLFADGTRNLLASILNNLTIMMSHLWTVLLSLLTIAMQTPQVQGNLAQSAMTIKQLQALQPMLSLLPNKTYLRPCEKTLTRYETRPGAYSSEAPEYYTTRCGCNAWFVYQQVPKTNLIMIILDSSIACRQMCDAVTQKGDLEDQMDILPGDESTESQVCSMVERESQLYRKKLDSCFAHHPEEEHIKICGAAMKSASINNLVMAILVLVSTGYSIGLKLTSLKL